MKIKFYFFLSIVILIFISSCSISDSAHINVVSIDTYQQLSTHYHNNPNSISALVDVITNQDIIKFSDDMFYIRINFSNPIKLSDLKANLTVKPNLKFSLHNFESDTNEYSKEWGILPENWSVGDSAVITIKSSDTENSFTLEKVNAPIIMNRQIISPLHRYEQNISEPLQKAYVLGNSKIRLTFNKPMSKSSITTLISKAVINSNYRVSCTWESKTSLVIQFISLTDKKPETISINLTGAKDEDGVSLIDDKGLVFYLVDGMSVSKYNYSNELQYQLTDEYNINQVALSLEGDLLVCSDILAENYDEKDKAIYNDLDLRLINLESYNTIFKKNISRKTLNNGNLTWSNSKYFFFNDTLYTKKGESLFSIDTEVISVAFSPDESNMALLTTNQSKLCLNIYSISEEILFEKEIKFNDSEALKSSIYYLNDNNIIYEKDYKIKTYNIANSSERTLLNGSINNFISCNVLSPDRTKIVYELTNGSVAIYSLASGKTIYTFNRNTTPQYFCWSADSSLFAYSTLPNNQINIITLENKSTKTLPLYGWPLGWDQEGNIIVCD